MPIDAITHRTKAGNHSIKSSLSADDPLSFKTVYHNTTELGLWFEVVRNIQLATQQNTSPTQEFPPVSPKKFITHIVRAAGKGIFSPQNSTIIDLQGNLPYSPPYSTPIRQSTEQSSSSNFSASNSRHAAPPSQPPAENTSLLHNAPIKPGNQKITLVLPVAQNLPKSSQLAITQRSKREVGETAEANNNPVSGSTSHLNGDLAVDQRSLIGSRILAVKNLYADSVENREDMDKVREDELWLEIGNQIHRDAQNDPTDQAAVELSDALYEEEIKVWGKENSADKFSANFEEQAQAFEEAWSLALDPPETPAFETREEIEQKVLEEIPITDPSRIFKCKAAHGGQISASSCVSHEVSIKYYTQFHHYISTHLDKLCTVQALSSFEESGLGKMWMEYRPDHGWVIEDITFLGTSKFIGPRLVPTSAKKTPLHASIFRLTEDKVAFIGPDGRFKLLDNTVINDDGSLDREQILRAHEIDFYTDNNRKGVKCPISNDQPCHISKYTIHYKKIDNIPEYPNGNGIKRASVKQIMESNIRKNILAAIEAWKEDNYGASTLEKVARTIIPFYNTIHKLRLDPGYQFKLEDITWDLVALAITIGTIGYAAIGRMSIKAGMLVARTMTGASATARASAAIRASIAGFKTSSFLLLTGRELTDFIIPVFTTRNIFNAVVRNKNSIKSLMQLAVRRSDDLILDAPKIDNVLEVIYKNIDEIYKKNAISAQEIKHYIDTKAEEKIPQVLYRGQSGKSIVSSRWGVVAEAQQDDYLAACIMHSARTGGSAGEALSLSMDKFVANRFSANKPDRHLLKINTEMDLENFRTIENILKYDGPRLVKNGKITTGTLAAAIKHAYRQRESEVFYTLGNIPENFVEVISHGSKSRSRRHHRHKHNLRSRA